MIIEEKILIIINSKNFNHFKNCDYDVKVGYQIEVLTTQLSDNSNYEIIAKCDDCGFENKIKMRSYTKSLTHHNYYCCKKCSMNKNIKTNKEKYGVEHTFQSIEIREKRYKNNIEKYGYGCTFQVEKFKNKIKETNLIKYGFDRASKNDKVIDKMKNTRIKLGIQLPDYMISDFVLYKRKVNRITKKNKKLLLLKWNGLDYYDNEYIKNNFSLDGHNVNYPSIDHKISIWYGFKKEISPDIIGDISNLCITKNYINSTKNIKIETQFNI